MRTGSAIALILLMAAIVGGTALQLFLGGR